ncbi:hypothetical protein CRE_10890 [Caenorhabditis remanei]|uniref:Uncharacterized protein n=1 Tax=Caenorhabditis remanei TaxID=31234 RepID=E3M5D0_CAERE|nr:hypothetical protein CRE_10890 [Caenorhabditis remanei]
MRQKNVTKLFAAIFVSLFLCLIVNSRNQSMYRIRMSAVEHVAKNYSAWNDCLIKNISIYNGKPDELWGNLSKGIKLCENSKEIKGISIVDYGNTDETKRHITPKHNKPSVIISLGIGHDTLAEQKLIKVFSPVFFCF